MRAENLAGVPMCVDLDGTLLRTDLLWEGLFACLRRKPLSLLSCFWMLVTQGRAAFKTAVAAHAELYMDLLPRNPELLQALQALHASGRKLVLCTAAVQSQAEALAASIGLFSEVLGTRDGINLSGAKKAKALVERFGVKGFDYAGNGAIDLLVWPQARKAWVVNASVGVLAAARKLGDVEQVFDAPSHRFYSLLKALRLHQAVKNLLVFVPVLAAHRWGDTQALINSAIAFFAFTLLAPATYLLNDALDLSADRQHPRKCHRPFASGALPLWVAAVAIPAMLVMSAVLALQLPAGFGLLLLSYLTLTLAYSFGLKRIALLDALTLAMLYLLRVLAGSGATGITPSFWLLAFSMFLFQSLALAKRYTELKLMSEMNRERAAGRAYETSDLSLLESMGTGSGYVAVLVLALYVNDPASYQLYTHPHLLWALCPVLMWWMGRVYMQTHRGLMHDDPVVFALKDVQSRLALAITAFLFLVAR